MSQAQRILKILSILQKEEQVCTQTLCDIFDANTRKVQRDIEILKEFLGDKLFSPKRGCYSLQSKNELFTYLKEQKELKPFFEFITLFDDKQFSIFDQKEFPIIKQIRREAKAYYHILENPIEELHSPHIETIKEAISQKRYASLTLNETELRELHDIKPLKIVFAEGNWYLAAMTKNYQANNGFKFFRINFITTFKLLPQTFHRDIESENFIKNFQSLFQNYNIPTYEVRLEVDAKVSRYFKVKKHLKSQQIIEEKPSGNLIMTYQINNEMELIPFIKKWLPHIRVLSPRSLKTQIKKEIALYLQED